MLKRMLGAAAMLALGAALPAHATTVSLSPDSTWHAFDVSDVLSADQGLGWFDINSLTGEALEFTIDVPAAQTVMLSVTDAGYAGDRFEVFDNGVSLDLTSAVAGGWRRCRCRPQLRRRARESELQSRVLLSWGPALTRSPAC